jgi:hypothetical protein
MRDRQRIPVPGDIIGQAGCVRFGEGINVADVGADPRQVVRVASLGRVEGAVVERCALVELSGDGYEGQEKTEEEQQPHLCDVLGFGEGASEREGRKRRGGKVLCRASAF